MTRDPNVAGRFIYHVADDRASERTGSTIALAKDTKADGGQVGERKVIPFKTKSIVTAGEITINADESKTRPYSIVFASSALHCDVCRCFVYGNCNTDSRVSCSHHYQYIYCYTGWGESDGVDMEAKVKRFLILA